MFRPLSDPALTAAFWTGLAAVLLALALCLAIVGLRLRLRARERHWQRFVATWRPLLLSAMLAEGGEPLPPLPRRDHVLFLRLWAYLHESLRGAAAERLNAAARSVGMDATARRLLASGSRPEKLLAALACGFLRDEQAWEPLVALARDEDSLLSVNAARALVRIQPLRGANGLLPLLVRRSDWDLASVAAFLGEARQAFWLLMARTIPRLEAGELPRALLLAEALRIQLPDATLARLLQAGQPAQVVQAALHLADTPQLAPDVRRCLRHEAAGVRAEAALRMGALALPADVPLLAALLDDAAWPVRMAAARALGQLPFLAHDELTALAARHPLAADALRQVLAERGLG